MSDYIPTLNDLYAALHGVSRRWYDIGLQLGFTGSDLKEIECDENTNKDRLRTMLDAWLNHQVDPPPSWQALTSVLRMPCIDEEQLARKLERKYCETSDHCTPGASNNQGASHSKRTKYSPASGQMLESNEAKAKASFARLVRQVASKLSQKSTIDMDQFHVFLVSLFPNVRIPAGRTIIEMFNTISSNNLWGFKNHYLLVQVAEEYGEEADGLNDDIDKFRTELSHFYVTKKVAEYIQKCDMGSTVHEPLPAAYYETYRHELSVTLDIMVTNETLEYIDKLWREIARYFMLPTLSAVLDHIKPGSIVITWAIPQESAHQIRENITSRYARDFLRSHYVSLVAIDGECLYKDEEESGLGAVSEEDASKFLKQIQDTASDQELAVVNYLFQALLPTEKHVTSILTWYTYLKQSQDYCYTALSLVSFAIQIACLERDQHQSLYAVHKQLQSYIEKHAAHKTEKQIPKQFILRVMLSKVLTELTGDQIHGMVTMMPQLHLETSLIQHPLLSVETGQKLFEQMEEKGLLRGGDSTLPELHTLLKKIGREDVVQEVLQQYNPAQPIFLAVMNTEGTLPTRERHLTESVTPAAESYHKCLVDAYDMMPVIPLNQWPPVWDELYASLALITNEAMSRHDIFSHDTIRGSVDDIYKKKIPAEFVQVFPERLSTDRRWLALIEGRPGCGKSTLITKASKDWAEGKILTDVELFVLIRLRRFLNKRSVTLNDIFGMYCDNPEVVAALIDHLVATEGKGVCFAFDGLDEYSGVFDKDNTIYKLIHGQLLPLANLYLTSRPAGSQRLRSSAILNQNVEIVGFLEEEQNKYIRKYYEEQPEKAADLLQYLQSHQNIARMCYLPLHIAVVVYLHSLDSKHLPATETDLYKMFVLYTLFRFLRREADDPEEDISKLHEFDDLPNERKPIFECICQLAFKATCERKHIFTGKEILDSDLPMIPNVKALNSLGLLTVDQTIADNDLLSNIFSFLHLTLQEFLAALYLVKYREDGEQLKIIQEHGGKPHMRMVWKFYSGLCSQKKIFIHAFQSIVAQNVSVLSDGLTALSMMHCAFESQRADACINVLTQLHGRVDVKDITLNPSDCAAIGYVAIHAHEELRNLDLSYCHLGPSGINAFVQQLETFKDLKLSRVGLLRMRARTDFNPVGSEGALSLVKFLKKLPNLGELRLYGNQLKTEKFKLLAPVIADMTKLHTLILSRNALDTSTGEHVSQILGNLSLLQIFYISYNPLKDDGLGAMKPGLLKCLDLKILGLRGTHLTEGAGVHMKDVLETLPKLEWVELYQNNLKDQGVIDMLPGLFKAKTIKKLSLVENDITDEGAKAIAAYLRFTDTMREMRMYYNHGMTDVGKIALRTAVVERSRDKCELKFAV